MPTVPKAIEETRQRIEAAARAADRDPSSVQLIAVSKTRPASAIRAAWDCGIKLFGESYAQEAVDKITQLANYPIEWHFIGPIQSNKTRQITQHFDWVHSIDRLKTARRLNDQRPDELTPLNVCIQINISAEDSKSGIDVNNVDEMATEIMTLPRLRLRGLMAIPTHTDDKALQFQMFSTVAETQHRLNNQGLELDTLSMGMSGDLEMAIKAGATHVRIGTAIFGARE